MSGQNAPGNKSRCVRMQTLQGLKIIVQNCCSFTTVIYNRRQAARQRPCTRRICVHQHEPEAACREPGVVCRDSGEGRLSKSVLDTVVRRARLSSDAGRTRQPEELKSIQAGGKPSILLHSPHLGGARPNPKTTPFRELFRRSPTTASAPHACTARTGPRSGDAHFQHFARSPPTRAPGCSRGAYSR
mgnify:CR=1 FL=1|jgi:hypothetical protein